jgi:hypothetical protein
MGVVAADSDSEGEGVRAADSDSEGDGALDAEGPADGIADGIAEGIANAIAEELAEGFADDEVPEAPVAVCACARTPESCAADSIATVPNRHLARARTAVIRTSVRRSGDVSQSPCASSRQRRRLRCVSIGPEKAYDSIAMLCEVLKPSVADSHSTCWEGS